MAGGKAAVMGVLLACTVLAVGGARTTGVAGAGDVTRSRRNPGELGINPAPVIGVLTQPIGA